MLMAGDRATLCPLPICSASSAAPYRCTRPVSKDAASASAAGKAVTPVLRGGDQGRQAAAVTVTTADRAGLPQRRGISDPLRGAGTGVTTGVITAWGRRGWGAVIGRHRLYGAAPLSATRRLTGGDLG